MSAARSGWFVAGTDTGVGKTLVACTLVRALRRRGTAVGVMKPIETGVGADGPCDALALREAAGVDDPLETICPQRFALPAAPTVAAEAEGREVDLDAVRAAFAILATRHKALVVEGAGGLLVPAAKGASMAESRAPRSERSTTPDSRSKPRRRARCRWPAWSSPTRTAHSLRRTPPTWTPSATTSANASWPRFPRSPQARPPTTAPSRN
jgi:dethiobiotin synthase